MLERGVHGLWRPRLAPLSAASGRGRRKGPSRSMMSHHQFSDIPEERVTLRVVLVARKAERGKRSREYTGEDLLVPFTLSAEMTNVYVEGTTAYDLYGGHLYPVSLQLVSTPMGELGKPDEGRGYLLYRTNDEDTRQIKEKIQGLVNALREDHWELENDRALDVLQYDGFRPGVSFEHDLTLTLVETTLVKQVAELPRDEATGR